MDTTYKDLIEQYILTRQAIVWPDDYSVRKNYMRKNCLDIPTLIGIPQNCLPLYLECALTTHGVTFSLISILTDAQVQPFRLHWNVPPYSVTPQKDSFISFTEFLGDALKNESLDTVWGYIAVLPELRQRYPKISDLFINAPEIPPDVEYRFSLTRS